FFPRIFQEFSGKFSMFQARNFQEFCGKIFGVLTSGTSSDAFSTLKNPKIFRGPAAPGPPAFSLCFRPPPAAENIGKNLTSDRPRAPPPPHFPPPPPVTV